MAQKVLTGHHRRLPPRIESRMMIRWFSLSGTHDQGNEKGKTLLGSHFIRE
jgi:hypothetical protein